MADEVIGLMKIDVLISYENGQLHTRSKAANYSEQRPSIIVLSRCPDGIQVVEAIGEPFDMEMRKAAWERDKGARTYTSFDPFAVDRFDLKQPRWFCFTSATRRTVT